jgi:hypothetical protein
LVTSSRGEDDLAAQQGQHLDLHVDALDLGHAPLRRRPFGVADAQAVDGGAGLPTEDVDVEIAVDGHLTAGALRRVARYRPAQHVPVEQRQDDNQPDYQDEENAAGPEEQLAMTA